MYLLICLMLGIGIVSAILINIGTEISIIAGIIGIIVDIILFIVLILRSR